MGEDNSILWGLWGEDHSIDPSKGAGGGVAFDNGKIFATSGFGDVVALDARTGRVLWKKKLGVPILNARNANGGRACVSTPENTV